MAQRVLLVMVLATLAAACASKPAAPPPAPEPVVVNEPPPEPVAEPPPPPPAKPEQGNGRWRVSVASERTAEQTEPWIKRLEGAGYSVTTESAEVEGTTWHRVVLGGYSLDGAQAMLPILEQEGLPNAWIIPRNPKASTAAAAPEAPEPEPAPDAQPAN